MAFLDEKFSVGISTRKLTHQVVALKDKPTIKFGSKAKQTGIWFFSVRAAGVLRVHDVGCAEDEVRELKTLKYVKEHSIRTHWLPWKMFLMRADLEWRHQLSSIQPYSSPILCSSAYRLIWFCTNTSCCQSQYGPKICRLWQFFLHKHLYLRSFLGQSPRCRDMSYYHGE